MYSCVCACAWMCRCRRQDVQVLIEASRHISVGCLLYLYTHYTHHWRSQMFSLKTNKIQWPNWCITVDYELWRLVEERRRILDHYIFALSFLSSIYLLLFFSSPNLSGRRLDVYHTSTHGMALVRIYNAGLKCAARGSLQIQDAKKSPKIAIWAPLHNFDGLYLRN